MSNVIGSIICTSCCGLPEILGTLPGGEQVTINLELFDVIGRDEKGLWIVNCPQRHHLVKLFFYSAQEHLDGFENKVGFPELKVARAR
jgi:hypothetical protein